MIATLETKSLNTETKTASLTTSITSIVGDGGDTADTPVMAPKLLIMQTLGLDLAHSSTTTGLPATSLPQAPNLLLHMINHVPIFNVISVVQLVIFSNIVISIRQ